MKPRFPLLVALVAALLAAAPAGALAAGGDPSANRALSADTESACAGDPSGSACLSSALADINAAHAAEGVRAMVLPAGFGSMSVPVQLLNLANLERTDRGMAPIAGLSAALDQDAQTAAAQDRDPMPTHFYGSVATGNWAAGYDSTLEADFAWMYDDGPGSDNIDCTSGNRSGCWGHRNDILWAFGTPIAMGAGDARGQYGRSMTELFVGGDTRTGPGQPDQPVVKPSPVADPASGAGSSSTSGGPTGHAAARSGRPRVRAWAGSVVAGGHRVRVTIGCSGAGRRTCTVKLTVVTAHAVVRRVTARVAAGQTKVITIVLGQRARRLLAAARRHRARLLVRQGARIVLSRTVSLG